MSTQDQKTIIVFAGVFDPVHNGHIAAAQEAANRFGGKVVFLPERKPWHKHGSTSYEHRLEMLHRATANNTALEVLDYPEEKQRVVETFTWLANEFPECDFIWLVGSDVVPHMHTWEGLGQLDKFRVRQIVVARREGTAALDIPITGLPSSIDITTLNTNFSSVSSSGIRQNTSAWADSLPEAVRLYAADKQLYKMES